MNASVVCSFCLKLTLGELIEENFVISKNFVISNQSLLS